MLVFLSQETSYFLRIDWNCFSRAAARCALDWKQMSSPFTSSTAALRSITGVNAVDFLTAKVDVIPTKADPLDLILSFCCTISAVLNPNADGAALLFGVTILFSFVSILEEFSDDCCGFNASNRWTSVCLPDCVSSICLDVPAGFAKDAVPVFSLESLPFSSSEKVTASITLLFRFSALFSPAFSPCSGMQTPIVKECPATI